MTKAEYERRYGVEEPHLRFEVGSEREIFGGLPERALATGAILFWNNDEPMTALPQLTPKDRGDQLDMLKEWWGISTPAEAVSTIEWLIKEGHRVAQAESLEEDPEPWVKLFEANDFISDYGFDGDTSGWDHVRIVCLARWCFDVGYLDEPTMWRYASIGMRLAAEQFDSWEELATSFVGGRLMWNEDVEQNQNFGLIAHRLLVKPESIWQRVPWVMPGI